MADLTALLDDLAAESAELDALVAPLEDMQWYEDTPAAGWTIATQIAHLAWTDEASILAATDAAEFARQVEAALPRMMTFADEAAFEKAEQAPESLLAEWRAGRDRLRTTLAAVPDGTKLPWFGPPMSAASMVTARMMETFAHGQDVFDTLGVARTPTDRLRHVAHIGARTRNFAYMVRNLPAPAEEFRIELTGPRGDLWTWGPQDATQRVTGPALDFCLLVTQRRHRDDLALVATGADANTWLGIAQAFAGPPGAGRMPAGAR